MKRILFLLVLMYSSTVFAQHRYAAGLNLGYSSSVGFVGINPHLTLHQPLSNRVDFTASARAFFDLNMNNERVLNQTINEFHRSAFLDIGLDILLVDRFTSWSINVGPSVNFNHESYVETYGMVGDQLMDLRISNLKQFEFGYFVNNSIGFGEVIDLNLTIHSYSYFGQYITIGPSFSIN